ncbi:MAG TPA: O-antigen ligase family protein [Candidatus Acidoferrum sp.]|nr:O-antigen ligase family protein [Candidatus Acidoferrum sp.]
MLLAIPIFIVAMGLLLFWFVANPSRLIYFVPVLLSFEYRIRITVFSFDLSELCFFLMAIVCLAHAWQGRRARSPENGSSERLPVVLLSVCALPAIFFEFNTAHAASVYRDLMLPFLFLLVFLRAGLEKHQIHTLIKLACVFALVNACLGIVQYATGNYLWFAGPDEADWQTYKTGLAKLSILGDFLGVRDTLAVGLYTGANNYACYLSLPLCLATTLAFYGGVPKRKRALCAAASVVMFVSLLFTMFRSGLLVFFASMMAVYFALSRQKGVLRVVIISLLAAIVAILFLTQGLLDWDQFGSFQGRQEMISAALALMKSHPELLLTGGYTDLYHLQSRETQEIHNLALYSIVQFGLPVTLLYFAFFIRLFRRAIPAVKALTGVERSTLVAIVASVGANVFVYGSTTMLIDSVQTSIWLLFWSGIATYLIDFAPARASAPAPAFVPSHAMFPEQGRLT